MLKLFSSKMHRKFLLQACIVLMRILFITAMEGPILPNVDSFDKIAFKGRPVAPCVACQKLVTSFLAAVNATSRDGFAGGDADWERNKLGNYENSELRFIEIQEKLCADVQLGIDQCYILAEENEAELEDWFYTKRKHNVDLHKSLCINHLKVCCPNNTYGSNCIPCPGGIEKPCGGHGKCMKGGTREEPASCSCDAGYKGDLCDECDKGYYKEIESTDLSCRICDRACKGHCRGPGPKNCEVCSFGYRFVPDEGCVEHFDDYKNKAKVEDETNKTEIEAPNKDLNAETEDFNLDPNVEDSADVPHSEL